MYPPEREMKIDIISVVTRLFQRDTHPFKAYIIWISFGIGMYERLVFSGHALIAITVFTLTPIWRLPLGPSGNYIYDIKANSYFFMYAYRHIVYIDIYHYVGILLCRTFNSRVVLEVGLNTSYSHLSKNNPDSKDLYHNICAYILYVGIDFMYL